MADCMNSNQGISRRTNGDASMSSSRASTAEANGATVVNRSYAALSPAPTASSQLATTATHVPSPFPASTSLAAGLPGEAEQRRLIKAYFDGPHYFCFYTFIHPPTLMQMFDNRLVPNSLLLIIIATALRFLDPHNHLADAWADECRRLVMLEVFSPPSTTTLQALLLLQRFEWHRASHVAAWFTSGLAVRLAHGLQLNLELSDEARVPVTVREIRRRLVWSCFVMESLIENGRRALANLDVGAIEVKLPCNEQAFQLGLETNMPALESSEDDHRREASLSTAGTGSSSAGSHASGGTQAPPTIVESRLGVSTFLVQLAVLRRAILDYTMPYHPRNKSHIPPGPAGAVWTPGSPFFAYEEKLRCWHQNLPQEMQFNADVLYRRQSSQLVSFITLHCLYHGCYCDLYRLGSYVNSLHRLSLREDSGGTAEDTTYGEVDQSCEALAAPPADFLADCRRGRVQHAFAICRVIAESMKHYPTGHDPVVGISASLAIRVLVIERQHDEDASLGLTNDILYEHLDAAVRCAKEIAQRSVPIRDLFFSVCELARKHGYDVDLSDIRGESINPRPSSPKPLHQLQSQDRERASSPSLRTYGTFGRIQNSLACRKDVLAPAASATTDKESDLFHHYDAPAKNYENKNGEQQRPPEQQQHEAGEGLSGATNAPDITPISPLLMAGNVGAHGVASSIAATDESSAWRIGEPWAAPAPPYGYPAYETYSPNELGVASAWGDGTLNFSMTPTQFDWINQSLGFDFNNGSAGGMPPYGGP